MALAKGSHDLQTFSDVVLLACTSLFGLLAHAAGPVAFRAALRATMPYCVSYGILRTSARSHVVVRACLFPHSRAGFLSLLHH